MRKLKQVVCVGYLNIVGYSAFEIEEASREEVLQTIHARSAGISLQEFHLLGPQKHLRKALDKENRRFMICAGD
jgi:hypothetical protein